MTSESNGKKLISQSIMPDKESEHSNEQIIKMRFVQVITELNELMNLANDLGLEVNLNVEEVRTISRAKHKVVDVEIWRRIL